MMMDLPSFSSRDTNSKSSKMSFDSKTPTFFTVVPEQLEPDQLLRVPKKCLAKLGDLLPKRVKLRIPNGDIWKVDFKKNEDYFWLPRGWKCFADHYSTNPPYCLVFRFDGQKGFDINILDKTAFEIEYPIAEKRYYTSGESSGEEDSRKSKNVASCSKTNKTTQLKIDDRESMAYRKAPPFESEPSFMVSLKPANVGPTYKMVIPSKFADTYLVEGNGKVILVVSDGRRWTFEYHMRWYKSDCNGKNQTYLSRKWKRLVEQNDLKVGDVCVFELVKNTNKKVLEVTIYHKETEKTNSSLTQVNLLDTPKCKRLVLVDESENGFKGNDSNGFNPEPLEALPIKDTKVNAIDTPKRKRLVLADESENGSRGNGSNGSNPEPLESLPIKDTKGTVGADFSSKKGLRKFRLGSSTKKTKANDSRNPSFTVFMHPTYMTTFRAYVPLGFAKKYLKEKRDDIILYVQDGRKWNAEYLRVFRGGEKEGANIVKGWKEFMSDNKLKAGDVCDFELIKYKPITLKVDIFRYDREKSKALVQSIGKDKKLKGETNPCPTGSGSSTKISVGAGLKSPSMTHSLLQLPYFFPDP